MGVGNFRSCKVKIIILMRKRRGGIYSRPIEWLMYRAGINPASTSDSIDRMPHNYTEAFDKPYINCKKHLTMNNLKLIISETDRFNLR